jgi:hypothetical protein
MARLADQVILFGGLDNSNTYLADTWIWDGTTWTIQSAVPPDPCAFGAMASKGGTTILFGGTTTRPGVIEGATWAWNGATWTEEEGFGGSPPARLYNSVTADGDRIVMFGGLGPDGIIYGDTWTWDASGWRQEHPVTSPPPRYRHGAASVH